MSGARQAACPYRPRLGAGALNRGRRPFLSDAMQQLPLAVQLRPQADFADYLPGPNAEAVAAVAAWADGVGDAFLYLFGPTGTGKTHLLQAACRVGAAHAAALLYLPLAHPGLAPAVLEDLERAELIALDDIHSVAGDAAWERGLFDLYNRLREAGRRLLVSADAPAAELPLGLPDLRSRLGWGPGYRLRPLGEDDCKQLLLKTAARRGLDLGAGAVGYILQRCPRDAGYLLGLLDELDRVSLQDKRRPSVWLIRQLLEGSQRAAATLLT